MAPGKITNEAFETKTAFGPNFKAGMDATTAEESFATILGNGSGWISKKFNDFFERHLFRVRHSAAALPDPWSSSGSLNIYYQLSTTANSFWKFSRYLHK